MVAAARSAMRAAIKSSSLNWASEELVTASSFPRNSVRSTATSPSSSSPGGVSQPRKLSVARVRSVLANSSSRTDSNLPISVVTVWRVFAILLTLVAQLEALPFFFLNIKNIRGLPHAEIGWFQSTRCQILFHIKFWLPRQDLRGMLFLILSGFEFRVFLVHPEFCGPSSSWRSGIIKRSVGGLETEM